VHYVSIVPSVVMQFAAMYRRGVTGRFLEPFLERIERSPGSTADMTSRDARRMAAP
jgi:hypothetical protein